MPGGPITIDADRLEVRDREKRAIFSGNVVAKRGDMIMRSTTMVVLYDGEQPAGAVQARGSTPGAQDQQIRRIELTGPVFFCHRDQAARGDRAVYERASETLVMTGNVVLTQGQNVVTGPRLVVNMRTNQAHVERDPANPNERVRSLLVPGDAPRAGAPPAQPASPQRPEC
jgi:lipopolysaccharide export system protein LptA